MTDALCKEGELQKIVDTLDRIMRRSTFRSPSMIVNCSLMLRILDRGSLTESESDVVVLLKRLLQKNLLHESVVWSLVLHAKVAFGDLDSAWGLYGEMVRKGFEPNAFVYTSFVGAFCRDGRVEEAIGLVREMEGKGLRPYGGGEAVERKGKVEESEWNVELLMDKGFLPADDVPFSVMQGYARKEEVQEVLKLYYEMEYRRVNPGLSVFATVVRCLSRCGKVEHAERYLRVMKERLVALDASVYEELIDGYIKKGDTARALYLREEMASLEL
ncbi:pentatricopeptide repeat-containing protein At1g66345, mitochondrial [Vigna umbellata]|uniref:pentatricopeptide repeat-containing protein At1g66345, mitochondrial n=1 Tax=Vigna umbellata TaxID=87088 RepID=UPI001F5F17DC|nr:pentatricopeptide repeat-containing protein At1g66345, mitochondrial [Vigna umbellata]